MVEFSPATREARVRFPADAFCCLISQWKRCDHQVSILKDVYVDCMILLSLKHQIALWNWQENLPSKYASAVGINNELLYQCYWAKKLLISLKTYRVCGCVTEIIGFYHTKTHTQWKKHFSFVPKHHRWFSGRNLACHAGSPSQFPADAFCCLFSQWKRGDHQVSIQKYVYVVRMIMLSLKHQIALWKWQENFPSKYASAVGINNELLY